jgi:hypothetical protein
MRLLKKIITELPTAVRGSAESQKGLTQDRAGRIFLKTFLPLSLIKTFQMYLFSAGSILPDSTLKGKVIFALVSLKVINPWHGNRTEGESERALS